LEVPVSEPPTKHAVGFISQYTADACNWQVVISNPYAFAPAAGSARPVITDLLPLTQLPAAAILLAHIE